MSGTLPRQDKGRLKPVILVVEDEAVIAADIRDALVGLGYDVVGPVARAEEAIRVARETRPDLILMDIHLTGPTDGIAATGIIKDALDTAVVYLTSYGDETTLQRAKHTQPHGYLLKPFEEADLRTTVEVALHKHYLESFAAERERWFSATLATIGDAVVATDARGLITYVNPAAERLTGVPRAVAEGQRLDDVFRVADSRGQPLSADGGVRERFNVLVPGDSSLLPPGTLREVNDVARPVLDDQGQVLGGVVVFRDVTERRRLERRVELAERVGTAATLAAGLAHEIANPLTYVLANVKAVKDELTALGGGPEGAKLRELAGLLVEATAGLERAALVARNLVRFAGTVKERRRMLDLPDTIEAAVNVVDNLLRHRARVEIACGATPYVEAAEHELAQVIVSLLANAIEAMSGEREHNKIVLRTLTDEAGRAVLEVQDNGPGIPPDVLPRVFEPFFTTKSGRSGLGLSLSQRIVQELGGEIRIASEPGRGTTARIVLPAARPAVTAPAPAPVAPRRRRFLVIEDEEMVARALSRILGKENEVVVETDPHLALARIARGELYDLVFCDVMMPKMSGRAVYQAVSVANEALTDRMVFVTGGVFTRELEEFLAGVKNPVLTKPFSTEAIRELVAKLR